MSLPLNDLVRDFSNWHISNLVNKVEDGEITEDAEGTRDVQNDEANKETAGTAAGDMNERKSINLQHSGWSRKDGNQRAVKKVNFKSLAFL